MKIKWRSILAAGLIASVLLAAFSMQTGATGGNGYPGGSNFTFTSGENNGVFIGWITDITPHKITGYAWKWTGANGDPTKRTPCQVKIDVYLAGSMSFVSTCMVTSNSSYYFEWVWGGGTSCFGQNLHLIMYAKNSSGSLMFGSTLADERTFYLPNHSKLTSGISGTKYYWIDSSVGVIPYITAAFTSWKDGNGVYNAGINFQRQTGNNAGTKIDFYKLASYFDDDMGKAAETRYYDSSDNLIDILDPNLTKNYTYTRIRYSANVFADIDDGYAQTLGFPTAANMRVGVLSHEIGHALGLNHSHIGVAPYGNPVGLKDRIMTQINAGCQVYAASWFDLKSVDVLY